MQERAESGRPWLFFREGIDWQWLSHRRVAARVADAVGNEGNAPSPAAFDVKTLVACLASRPQAEPEAISLLSRLEMLPWRTAKDVRPIVFAAPEAYALDAVALATLKLEAAWAIEPQADAFVATARWVRPTIVVAPEPALDALADAWDAGDKRWSRLRALVLWPLGAEVPDASLQRWRDVLGCTVLT